MSRELPPYSTYARECYLKGNLRKMELMASLVERLKKTHGNIRKPFLYSFIAKFDQRKYSTTLDAILV